MDIFGFLRIKKKLTDIGFVFGFLVGLFGFWFFSGIGYD